MKHNMKKITLFVLAAGLFAAGCKKVDFGDTNVNPNATTTPITAALLTNVLSQMANDVWDAGGISTVAGLYCQFGAETQYTDASRYAKPTFDLGGYYTGPLYDLQNIINTNESSPEAASKYGSNANQIAVARILKAYFFWKVTDYWGDIPYSNALKGSGLDQTYDKQQDIYPALINELKAAVAQFDGGGAPQGDILFDGDIDQWKKFANSIRLLMALRMSKVNASLGQTEFNSALSAGVISSNAENAKLAFPGGNFNSPFYGYYNITMRRDLAVSNTVIDWLDENGDNRINAFGSSNVGFTYGLTRDDAIAFANANTNWARMMSNSLRTSTQAIPIITASHIMLARAEAAQRGWTSENAATLYQNGIQASWEEWGVYNATAFGTYMGDADVALTSGTELAKIATQQWLAYFPNGSQGFANWRRTGYPVLAPAPGQANAIPRRFPHGTTEQQNNKTNWENGTAVYTVSGESDSQWGKVWWDN